LRRKSTRWTSRNGDDGHRTVMRYVIHGSLERLALRSGRGTATSYAWCPSHTRRSGAEAKTFAIDSPQFSRNHFTGRAARSYERAHLVGRRDARTAGVRKRAGHAAAMMSMRRCRPTYMSSLKMPGIASARRSRAASSSRNVLPRTRARTVAHRVRTRGETRTHGTADGRLAPMRCRKIHRATSTPSRCECVLRVGPANAIEVPHGAAACGPHLVSSRLIEYELPPPCHCDRRTRVNCSAHVGHRVEPIG